MEGEGDIREIRRGVNGGRAGRERKKVEGQGKRKWGEKEMEEEVM